MRNISVFVLVLLQKVCLNFGATISVEFRHEYPCDRHLPSQGTTSTCTYDKDCTENAYCRNHEACYCMNGYILNRNRTTLECLKIASEIGDPCTDHLQCRVTFTPQSECRNNVCSCSEGSHYEPEAKRCYESMEIGQMCQTSYNCYIEGGSPSFCVDGFCSCPLQHHPYGKDCLKSAFLGDECSVDEECLDSYSRCIGTCSCEDDYALSKNGKKCLKLAKLMGDPCTEDIQCNTHLKNTKCGDNKTCTCLMNFKRPGSICLRKLNPQMIGKKCTNWTQCLEPTIPEIIPDDTEVTNVDCISGICSCAEGYTLTESLNECIRFSENGEASYSYSYMYKTKTCASDNYKHNKGNLFFPFRYTKDKRSINFSLRFLLNSHLRRSLKLDYVQKIKWKNTCGYIYSLSEKRIFYPRLSKNFYHLFPEIYFFAARKWKRSICPKNGLL